MHSLPLNASNMLEVRNIFAHLRIFSSLFLEAAQILLFFAFAMLFKLLFSHEDMHYPFY